MSRLPIFLFLVAFGGACGGADRKSTDTGAPADVVADALLATDTSPETGAPDVPANDDLPTAADASEEPWSMSEVELVASGYTGAEGPVWRGDHLLFSEPPGDTIYKLVEPDTVTVFLTPTNNINGLYSAIDGGLLACETGLRRVTHHSPTGEVTVLADEFEGKKLNKPNDIVQRSDGTIYFTDPGYGFEDVDLDLDFRGVFRIDPAGTLTAELRGPLSQKPNGIILSPDEATLYIAVTTNRSILAADVAADGSLSNIREFAATDRAPDGMTVDPYGRVYAATVGKVEVFSPDGTPLSSLALPADTTGPRNVTFGGSDGRTLYITGFEKLFRSRVTFGPTP